MFKWFKSNSTKEPENEAPTKKVIIRVIPYEDVPAIATLYAAITSNGKKSYKAKVELWRKIAESVSLVLRYPATFVTDSPVKPYLLITVPIDFVDTGDPGEKTYACRELNTFGVVENPGNLAYANLVVAYKELAIKFKELKRSVNSQSERMASIAGEISKAAEDCTKIRAEDLAFTIDATERQK